MQPPRTHTVDTPTVTLAAEEFGLESDPAVLLIAGMSASMLWWEADWCRALAQSGWRVIRFDNRDTGRSTTGARGTADYSTGDLVNDAVALLDGLDIASAHVVGHSLGAGLALGLAVDHPDRVRSLALAGTSTGESALPQGSASFPEPPRDLDDRDALIEYLVADTIACDADSPRLDPAAVRRLAETDTDRARDMGATITNPPQMRFTEPSGGGHQAVRVPTLVLHGERDAILPLEHGQAVHQAVSNSRLVVLEGAGHTLQSADADQLVGALLDHLEAAR